MVNKTQLNEVITNGAVLGQRYIVRDGFVFVAITEPGNVYDAIVIMNPSDLRCLSPRIPNSPRSLEDHISLVNSLKLEKALIYAADISFLSACPSLKYLSVLPADEAGDNFDFSPLYALPEITQLHCRTEYGTHDQYLGNVDYSRIHGLRRVSISGKGHQNYQQVPTLLKLGISGYRGKQADLTDLFESKQLEAITMIQCPIRSLAGINRSETIHTVIMSYCRSLSDISDLVLVNSSLKKLRIEKCPKVQDFSCLANLTNLERLEIFGNNMIQDLHFLDGMKNLKYFSFDVPIANGDLSPCLSIPHVKSLKDRKNYNYKNAELPKKN